METHNMKTRHDLIQELMDCYFHGVIAGFVQTTTMVRMRFTPYTNPNTKVKIQDYIHRTYPKVTASELDSYYNELLIIYPQQL